MTPSTTSNRRKILLVDDDPGLLRLLTIRLMTSGYEVESVDSGEKALARLPVFQPDLVITDLRMEGMDGMALFNVIHRRDPVLPVLILTAHGTIPDAVEATRRGIFAYLTKPFEGGALLGHVSQALRLGVKPPEAGAVSESTAWRSEIVTRSAAMEALLREARLVSEVDASVFICGASGTGKELLAKAIHKASRRSTRPFIAVNCAAIPEGLLESELFGCRKGAYTGATQDRPGLFQAAHHGTLLLDEIGDMPPALQVKLLRTLEEKEVRPVGAIEVQPVDVRVISATHRHLETEVAAGRFRQDLYYRLNVVTLEIPSLAERREDIPLLASHFLSRLAKEAGKAISRFAPEAMEHLVQAPWPGNVRQLQNVVEYTVAIATTPIIPATLVQKALRDPPAGLLSFGEARSQFEHDYLIRLLRTTGGNVSQAARFAQRGRTEFYKLLRRHELDPTLFRRPEKGQIEA
ncbi:MAG: sigma 54-interacting transcriptional regulator [Gammaproteobacteria bacterium]